MREKYAQCVRLGRSVIGNRIAEYTFFLLLLQSPNCVVKRHDDASICNWGFITTTGKTYTHNRVAILLPQLYFLSKLPSLRPGRLVHKSFTPTTSVSFEVTSNTSLLPCQDKDKLSKYYRCIRSPFAIRECL